MANFNIFYVFIPFVLLKKRVLGTVFAYQKIDIVIETTYTIKYDDDMSDMRYFSMNTRYVDY